MAYGEKGEGWRVKGKGWRVRRVKGEKVERWRVRRVRRLKGGG